MHPDTCDMCLLTLELVAEEGCLENEKWGLLSSVQCIYHPLNLNYAKRAMNFVKIASTHYKWVHTNSCIWGIAIFQTEFTTFSVIVGKGLS